MSSFHALCVRLQPEPIRHWALAFQFQKRLLLHPPAVTPPQPLDRSRLLRRRLNPPKNKLRRRRTLFGRKIGSDGTRPISVGWMLIENGRPLQFRRCRHALTSFSVNWQRAKRHRRSEPRLVSTSLRMSLTTTVLTSSV